jgi:hypothetical protein
MSPTKSLPPPKRSSAKRAARSDSDENIIDTSEVETPFHADDEWSIADIFANLWPDEHGQDGWSAAKSGEAAPRPHKDQSTGQTWSWRNFMDRAAKPVHDELDDAPTGQKVVWALLRDESGWYIYFNHNYRKLIMVIVITLALLATGKISEAVELVFKLFF